MADTYDMHVSVEAHTADQLGRTLRQIAHHIEAEHDLGQSGRVVDTITGGGDGAASWSVRVDHQPTTVDA